MCYMVMVAEGLLCLVISSAEMKTPSSAMARIHVSFVQKKLCKHVFVVFEAACSHCNSLWEKMCDAMCPYRSNIVHYI